MRERPRAPALFGAWLRHRRRQLELTQADLAASAGCSVATIRKLESDQRRPSERLAGRIAEAVGVDPPERAAFMRFARSGWSESPPVDPPEPLTRPWAVEASDTEPRPDADAVPTPERPLNAAEPRPPEATGSGPPGRDGPLRPDVRLRPRLPDATLRPPRLVGRSELWGRMERAWRAGRNITLSGPGGIGKSRLMEDFARSKGSVLSMCANPGDPVLPYSTLRRAFRHYLRQVPDGIDDLPAWARLEVGRFLPEFAASPPRPPAQDAGRLRFFEAVLRLNLAMGRRFATVIGDDLHYFDSSSFEVQGWAVAEIVRRGDRSIARSINAFRPAELPAEYVTVVERMAASGVSVVLEVAALGRADVRDLLAVLGVPAGALDAEAVFEVTGGNPLHVIEAAKGWWETRHPAPASRSAQAWASTAARTIRERLARLEPGDLHAAQALALLHETPSHDQLARLLGEPPERVLERLRRLERLNLVRERRFVHDLLAEEAVDLLPAARRRWLHGRAARVLAEDGAEPSRVAHHYEAAGEMGQAVRWRLQAAERALEQNARIEARRWLAWVVEQGPAAGPVAARAGVLLGEASVGTDVKAARAAFERSRSAARRAAQPALEARALAGLARSAALLGQDAVARRRALEAADLAEVLPADERAHVLLALGEARRSLGDIAAGEAWTSEAVRLAPHRPRFRLALARLHSDQGRYREAADALQEVVRTDPASARETAVLPDLGRAQLALGRLDAASGWLHRALEVWADAGDPLMEAQVREALGIACAGRGSLERAERELLAAAELFRRQGAGARYGFVGAERAYLRILACQPAAALVLAEEALDGLGRGSFRTARCVTLAALALAHAHLGAVVEAATCVDEAGHSADADGGVLERLATLRARAEVAALAGDARRLASAGAALLALAEACGMQEQRAWAHALLAWLPRAAAARRHARSALRQAVEGGYLPVEQRAAKRLALLSGDDAMARRAATLEQRLAHLRPLDRAPHGPEGAG